MAPANFAMVMGTGIVAVALAGKELHAPAVALCLLCAVMWLANALLLVLRAALFPRQLAADAAHPPRAPGFLTLVAGTNVLCSAIVLILRSSVTGEPQAWGGAAQSFGDVARFLFWTGAGLWGVLVFGLWSALCAAAPKKPVEEAVNGAWLLFTVSTQSVVVAAASLWEKVPDEALFALLALFLLGAALYFLIMPIILYRLMFKALAPGDFGPSYWIDAGAMAITCLAGVKLAPLLQGSPDLAALAPLVRAGAAGAWAVALFWVPCLLLLESWRHITRRYPIRYGVEYWSMVFPLGMLSACTEALAGLFPAAGSVLGFLSAAFLAIAVPVWLAVFLGLCRWLWMTVARSCS